MTIRRVLGRHADVRGEFSGATMMIRIMRFVLVVVGLGMREPPRGVGETGRCERDGAEIRSEWTTRGRLTVTVPPGPGNPG